ncbi:hypothetical protein OF897_06800 [Chryseobacterium formosus]|uniref:DUF4468 domain-containing protein n=1 Tax=Chryseobacterium formosus TaxID=1537363 RepID=A0ABT3XNB1_9FLAO|nr:hypothetical protein [Chryseobacterium formosus]MCX8523628.1 hypothetical protein [Chryseobacterium formosus]
MKIKLTLLLLIQTFLLNAQISNKIKKMVEKIDGKYFTVIQKKDYDSIIYGELNTLFSEISKTATNDELFFLALNGNTFIRHNAATSLVYKKDKRIIDLYRYYSELPMMYKIKMSHVIQIQDMALNIRGNILTELKNYENYNFLKSKQMNHSITDFYSKEDISYYENLDSEVLKNFINEFEKIDKIFIPERLEVYKEIKDNWIDDKLQKPNDQ